MEHHGVQPTGCMDNGTGTFCGVPCYGHHRKIDQFRFKRIQGCASGRRCDRMSSLYHLALEMCSDISLHATTNHFGYVTHACYPSPLSLHPSNLPLPWATNRSLLWRPVLMPSQVNRPIPAQPYPELCTRRAVWSDVIVASPRTRDELRHLPTCYQPVRLFHTYIPSITTIPATIRPTMAKTECTHAITVIYLSAIHARL